MRGTQFADLNVFVAVADQASFTKAARLLGLSTATLSQTIRALEGRLGVRLLNRTTRSVAPTDAGERLLTQLRPLLDGFDAAIESVNAFREKPAGHLRL
jgi:DNA-binding transcriptional LysR family regulator